MIETLVPAQSVIPANYADDFESVLRQPQAPTRHSLPVVTYRRPFITSSGLALSKMRLISQTGFGEVRPEITRHLERYARYKFLTQRRIRPNQPGLLLIHNHWSSGYHHWITEALVKLMFIDPERHVALLPSTYPRFAAESLDLMGVGDVLAIPEGHGVVPGSVTIIGNPQSGHYSPDHVAWLRGSLIARCERAPGPERIYITRRSEKVRRIENEAEVVKVMVAHGFEVLDAGTLSLRQQVSLFAGCRALVGLHGAGMTNCLFMAPGSRVLELYRTLTPRDPGMNTCYWNLSRAAGLFYYYQFCEHGQNAGTHIDRTNVIVDTDRLDANIRLMVSDL